MFLLIVERVESVEELFLRALFSGDELNVVNEKEIHGAVAIAETDHAIEAQGIDHVVGEFFSADVGEAKRGIALLHHVANGLHQVSLAQANSSVEEERVVGLRRLLGDGESGGVRELI